MTKALLIELAGPASSEADPQCAEAGCVTAVISYRQANEVGSRPRYVAVYELETDDVGSVADSFSAAAGDRTFTATETIDMEGIPARRDLGHCGRDTWSFPSATRANA